MLKAALKPLEQGFGNLLSGLFGGGFGFANGGVFQQGMPVPFAAGGVISEPGVVSARRGTAWGSRASAGAEAIMPLARGPDGRLGVAAQGRRRRRQRDVQRDDAGRGEFPALGDAGGGHAGARGGARPAEFVSVRPSEAGVGRPDRATHFISRVRFPTAISRGAQGGPERRTDVVVLGSGFEERNSRWANSRRSYNAGYGVGRSTICIG